MHQEELNRYSLDLMLEELSTICRSLGAVAKLQKVTLCFVMSASLSDLCPSVRPSAWTNSTPKGGIFVKFDICVFFENLSRKLRFHYNQTRITGTLREELCTFFISSGTVLTMRNVSDKSCREKSKHTFDVQ